RPALSSSVTSIAAALKASARVLSPATVMKLPDPSGSSFRSMSLPLWAAIGLSFLVTVAPPHHPPARHPRTPRSGDLGDPRGARAVGKSDWVREASPSARPRMTARSGGG